MRIVFRADASIRIGSGHVMRCLTLADILRELGAETTFVCREHPGHLFELIESKGHRLIRLAAPAEFSSGSLAYADWLGETQEEDAHQVLGSLGDMGCCDWLVVDHYALDAQWEMLMRGSARNVMVIDDLADRQHDCDILLDQNYCLGMESRYADLVPRQCRKLLGPKYALLRPEFLEARRGLRPRDGRIERILMFFGGSDPSNETAKALQAIKLLGRNDVAVDVVIGAANPHQEEIASLCAALPQTMLHRQASNMAELMSNADLAVGAGGGTMWERCCLGLPAIMTSIADNQRAGCEAVARRGGGIYLGEAASARVELLEAGLRLALSSPWLLVGASEWGMALVDGHGGRRAARHLMSPLVGLRRAESADCEPIFRWRNAEETRRFSSSSAPLDLGQHTAWFQKVLQDPERQILIGEAEGKAIGVLRYDRNGKSALVSVYLVPGNHGRGLGARLIEQGTSWIGANWPGVEIIEAVILEGNAASLAVFSEAGFEENSRVYVKQVRG